MKKLKNNRGITLVALIVTIIILLILAGVTIALLSGEDGILSRTEKAATSYKTESIKEVVNLKLANLNAGKWIDEGRKAVLKDLNELDDESSSNFDTEITLKNQVQDNDISAILIYDQHEIEVDSLLNIAKVDGIKQEELSSGANSGESSGNSGSINSEEYQQMQEKIAQMQQEITNLKAQSATKVELSTMEENYATKTELSEEIEYLKSTAKGVYASQILYPGGTESNPPTITKNQRIEIDNPYPGHTLYLVAQIYINGLWGETGYIYNAANDQSLGIKATQLQSDTVDKIVIQSGTNSLLAWSYNSGNPFNFLSGGMESAPYRIRVVCLD